MGGEGEKGAGGEKGTEQGYCTLGLKEEGGGGGDGLESNPAGSRSCRPCGVRAVWGRGKGRGRGISGLSHRSLNPETQVQRIQ